MAKAVGMVLAAHILQKDSPLCAWSTPLEAHDVFYICSDVLYSISFRTASGCCAKKQRTGPPSSEVRRREPRRILGRHLPHLIRGIRWRCSDYFGSAPIIVRSSSLSEDASALVSPRQVRERLLRQPGLAGTSARGLHVSVRTVYASTMSETRPCASRAQAALLDRDEQMCSLVQRCFGVFYGRLFHPQAAGVAFSFNPMPGASASAEAGVMRLVFGLGTDASRPPRDDYTRVVGVELAGTEGSRAGIDQVRRYTQREVDVLDMDQTRWSRATLIDVVATQSSLRLSQLPCPDRDLAPQFAGAA